MDDDLHPIVPTQSKGSQFSLPNTLQIVENMLTKKNSPRVLDLNLRNCKLSTAKCSQ